MKKVISNRFSKKKERDTRWERFYKASDEEKKIIDPDLYMKVKKRKEDLLENALKKKEKMKQDYESDK